MQDGDSNSHRFLEAAIRSESENTLDIVTFLCEHKAKPNTSVLEAAIKSESLSVVEYLLQQGMDTNVILKRPYGLKETLLHTALECWKPEMDLNLSGLWQPEAVVGSQMITLLLDYGKGAVIIYGKRVGGILNRAPPTVTNYVFASLHPVLKATTGGLQSSSVPSITRLFHCHRQLCLTITNP